MSGTAPGTAESNPSDMSGSGWGGVAAASISAIGSLPQHLMALVVAFAISDGFAGVEQASWISAAFVCGMMLGTVGLPLVGVSRMPRSAAVAVLSTMALAAVAALLGTRSLGPMALLAWASIGAACGALSVLGSLYAASRADGRGFLQLRLGLVLLGSAALLGAAKGLGLFRGYADAMAMLLVLPLAGLLLVPCYSPPRPGRRPAAPSVAEGRRVWIALFVLALFFAGQPGFTAYSAHLAASNGLVLADLPWLFAASKGAAAFVLLAAARRPASQAPGRWLSCLLALAILGLATAGSHAAFLAALLAWEVAVNLQSTRYQALVLRQFPAQGGRWLMAAIACGAAVGPVVHGALLDRGLGTCFLVFSLATAFIPVCWSWRTQPNTVAP